jgi:hypothetical protein
VIFRPELADLVARGVKTETRRPVKPGQTCRYHPSREYAVQPGRGQHAVARIRVTDVWQEALSDITPESIEREGFASYRAFDTYWKKLYGHVDHEQRVWAIRFELVNQEPAA